MECIYCHGQLEKMDRDWYCTECGSWMDLENYEQDSYELYIEEDDEV